MCWKIYFINLKVNCSKFCISLCPLPTKLFKSTTVSFFLFLVCCWFLPEKQHRFEISFFFPLKHIYFIQVYKRDDYKEDRKKRSRRNEKLPKKYNKNNLMSKNIFVLSFPSVASSFSFFLAFLLPTRSLKYI